MKHSIKTLLALFIVISATVAKAADPASVAAICKVVAEHEDKHYRVIYKAPEKSNVTLYLYDEKNKVIYTESQQSTSGFMKKLDLSNLPNGEYQLEVKADGYLFQEKISLGSVTGFNVVLSPHSSREVFFAASHKSGKSINLYILDQYGDVVYKEAFEDASAVHKMYNFKKLRSDKVTFVLYHNDQLIKEKEIKF